MLDKSLFHKFIYSKVLTLLTIFCMVGLWLLDVLFSYFGGVLSFGEFVLIALKLIGFILIIIIPIDLYFIYKHRVKRK